MSKIIFRTSLVHSCFSPDLNDPRPAKCNCRKLVTKERASEMVKIGEADWLINYEGEVPLPTWNLVLKGRTGKTPRSHTLEKAHIQRGVQFDSVSDEGEMARKMESAALGDTEQIELFDLYHDLEMEERYRFFSCGKSLQKLKGFSDSFGSVEGKVGKYVEEIIVTRANELKLSVAQDDPFEGRTLFPLIGFDQRTKF